MLALALAAPWTRAPFRQVIVASVFVLGACSKDPGAGSTGTPCIADSQCFSGACVQGSCATNKPDAGADTDASVIVVPDAGPVRRLVRVTVDPGNTTLVSTDGARATQAFTAMGEFSDGTLGTVSPRWSLDNLTLGDINLGSGLFTASGFYGGSTQVVARVTDGATEVVGQATLLVRLENTIVTPGTDPAAPQRFGAQPTVDVARAAGVAYPLDGAVMPQNVFPADVQWRNGAAGDIFRVRVSKPSAQITAFVGYDGNNHWQVEEAAWRRLAQTDPDAPATVEVTRWDSATQQLVDGTSVSVRFAKVALSGSIYYWDIAAGRIVRINDGTNTRDSFLPNPPLGCVGCHSISTSGRYMAGRFGGGDNIAGVLDLTRDLTPNPPPLEYPVGDGTIRWWFSSWSPDDRRLIVSTDEGSTRTLRLVDPFRGVYLDPQGGTLPTGATHPAWSPDGTAIAYVSDLDAWGGANTAGNVYVLPVTGPDTFGTPARLNDGTAMPMAVPMGNADSYPTWTPDSTALVFAHGNSSRSENGQAALYFMKRDGSGLVRLTKASGGVAAADTFQPRMSPFSRGDYYWVSYLTRRDYGNAQAGTAGTGRQQIWISAVRKGALPGEDPSEVGYWLPGQSTASMNISAYWAPRACRAEGESCSVASECCGNDCRPDLQGNPVCGPDNSTTCGALGAPCTASADCCDGVICSAAGRCGDF